MLLEFEGLAVGELKLQNVFDFSKSGKLLGSLHRQFQGNTDLDAEDTVYLTGVEIDCAIGINPSIANKAIETNDPEGISVEKKLFLLRKLLYIYIQEMGVGRDYARFCSERTDSISNTVKLGRLVAAHKEITEV